MVDWNAIAQSGLKYGLMVWIAAGCAITAGCAQVSVPDARTLDVPPPKLADQRKKAVNERPDSVMYLPLGDDVLVPEIAAASLLPYDEIGPFELRSETLAGALQLILADYDISLAFETEEGLNRRITVANLRGPLHTVVNRVCSLANLYCSYEDGILVVKDTQTFTVTLPPIGGGTDGEQETDFLDDVAEGLGAILGEGADEPIVDPTTRTIVYNATQRTSDIADRYFQRLRANTALIVFETYIWEVQLDSGNSTGIDWDQIEAFGKFNTSISINGSVASDFTNPVSIGLPTTQSIAGAPSDLVQFLSQFGAVKSISQPQIAVLSGSTADLRVADTENYVSEIVTTVDEGQSTTSVSTDSVDTGFELSIGSSWDKATVYANINMLLTNVINIEDFTFSDSGADGTDTTIQLPQTSERELTTNIRVRPGDSILIAGLVREDDRFSSRGPGIMEPILPDSRTVDVENLELVVLLRPRVVVYTSENDPRYLDFVASKADGPLSSVMKASPAPAPIPEYTPEYTNRYDSESLSAISAPVTPAPAAPVVTPEPVAPIVVAEPEPIDLLKASPPPPAPVVAEPSVEIYEPAAYTAPTPEPVVSTQTYEPNYAEPVYNDVRPSAIGRYGSGYVSRSSDLSDTTSANVSPSYEGGVSYDPAPLPQSDVYVPAPPQETLSAPSASPYESTDYYVPSY